MKWKRSKKAQQEEKNGKKDGKEKSDGDKIDDEGQVTNINSILSNDDYRFTFKK